MILCFYVSTPIALGVTGEVLFFILPFICIFGILKERIFSVKRQEIAWEWRCSVTGAVAVLES